VTLRFDIDSFLSLFFSKYLATKQCVLSSVTAWFDGPVQNTFRSIQPI